MGQGGQGRALGNAHVEHLLEVLGLGDQQQVEGPGPGKVGHNDGPHRHTRENLKLEKDKMPVPMIIINVIFC